jgi:hypothetical protein
MRPIDRLNVGASRAAAKVLISSGSPGGFAVVAPEFVAWRGLSALAAPQPEPRHRGNKIRVAYAERACEFKQRHHRRIATACFEAADILLRKARSLGKTFLGKVFCSSNS